jgi:hypothetical protein
VREDSIKGIIYYDIANYYSVDCSDTRVDANGNIVDAPLNYEEVKDNLPSSSTYAIAYTRQAGSHGSCTNATDGTSLVPAYPKHAISYISKTTDVLADINSTGYVEKYYSNPGCDARAFMGANWFSQEICHNSLSPNSLPQTKSFQFTKFVAAGGILPIKFQKFSDENCTTEITTSDITFHVQRPIINFDESTCVVAGASKYSSGFITSGNYYFQSGTVTALGGTDSHTPTSSPTFVSEEWTQSGQMVWGRKRSRRGGLCENMCSGHGMCEVNQNCVCYKGLDGEPEWTGPGDSFAFALYFLFHIITRMMVSYFYVQFMNCTIFRLFTTHMPSRLRMGWRSC